MPKSDDFPPLGLFVDFNIQVTSFLDNATLNEYVKLLGHSKGQLTIVGPVSESVHPSYYCRVAP